MKFICLGYADPTKFAEMKEPELTALMQECLAYDEKLRRGGQYAGGEALRPADQAVTLRYRNNQAVVTDGPFAETKEQLGGILLLEANDMSHAIELMSLHPGVKLGPFEIRPADETINDLIAAHGLPSMKAERDVELLLSVFQDHLRYIEQALADVPDERFVDQPQGVVNHPAWTLSHLNVSLRFLLRLLDEPQYELSAEDQRRFGPGSIPTTLRSDYSSKSELLAELRTLHAATEVAVRAKHASYFLRESPKEILEFAPTVGRVAVYLLASHEAYHLGQINQWRRATVNMHNEDHTVRLHRVLRAPTSRVYRAFLDADALCRWLPPYGFLGQIHSFDATVGGGYRMSFSNFDTGQVHAFEARFVELIPNERIRHVDKFDDPNLPGEMDVTITLRSVQCGTDLTIVQAGIPEVIPVEMCYHGWQESLLQLAQLVEHEIPN